VNKNTHKKKICWTHKQENIPKKKKTLSLAEKVAKAMKNRKEIERAREENEKKRRTK
jgi:hypothetical protein